MSELPAPWDGIEDPAAWLPLLMQMARMTAEHADYLEEHPPSLPDNPAAVTSAREAEFGRLRDWFEKTKNPLSKVAGSLMTATGRPFGAGRQCDSCRVAF